MPEKSLHQNLKQWYAQPGDQLEVVVNDFIIDVVRGKLLIEIQTSNVSTIKFKLAKLIKLNHNVRLVLPIAKEKWIVRQTNNGATISRRKSPKTGRYIDAFRELVYISHLITIPRFSLEILLIQEEQLLRDDGKGSWRRKGWSIYDRKLLGVSDRKVFTQISDYLSIFPPDLSLRFTNSDLARILRCRRSLAQKITYTLRNSGIIKDVGRRKRARVYKFI